jgi:GDP-4-dehydro-6-deoxy-D-mannose reductase
VRLLVTGAGGFLGGHLVAHLLASGDTVFATSTPPLPALPGATVLEADILEPAALARALELARPEAVVHLAGLAHVGASWERPGEYFRVNVLGTENVVQAAQGAQVVLASSAEVYGPAGAAPIPEAAPYAPASPYALTKAAAERLVLAAGGVVLRSFNVIGPGQVPTFALPGFARQLATIARGESEPVLRVGNLEARRDFVHVEDAARAYRLVAERGEAGGIYNLASGRAHSIAEMLAALCRVAGLAPRIEVDPERFRPTDVPVLEGDASRLRALGWAPEHSVEAALTDLWRATVAAA